MCSLVLYDYCINITLYILHEVNSAEVLEEWVCLSSLIHCCYFWFDLKDKCVFAQTSPATLPFIIFSGSNLSLVLLLWFCFPETAPSVISRGLRTKSWRVNPGTGRRLAARRDPRPCHSNTTQSTGIQSQRALRGAIIPWPIASR